MGVGRVDRSLTTAAAWWQVMKTLAKRCSRQRKFSPEVMQAKFVRAAFDTVNWDNTEEVTTLFYLAKNLVWGRRASDELMLDWDDVEWVEATESTQGGAVSCSSRIQSE